MCFIFAIYFRCHINVGDRKMRFSRIWNVLKTKKERKKTQKNAEKTEKCKIKISLSILSISFKKDSYFFTKNKLLLKYK